MARAILRVIVPNITDEAAIALKKVIEELIEDKPDSVVMLDIR